MTPIISDGFGRPKTALRVSYSRPGLPTQLTRIVEKILLSFKGITKTDKKCRRRNIERKQEIVII